MGLFHDDHMEYHLKAKDQPTLEEMVEIAIKMLSRSPNGYFLFVEGLYDLCSTIKLYFGFRKIEKTLESKAPCKVVLLLSNQQGSDADMLSWWGRLDCR